uniref:RagB/SusD family nutrient uptake outer membrane protein n=1 Tax=Pedobacter schmidteae TaxID=2201271 RepID=UPI000EB28A40|nr:RagB/SusD family nutrient uptake outer membrane protein [Pedobacter schmidteae]
MKTKYLIYLAIGLCFLTACKEEFLELKQDKSLVIPTTLKDYQGLIDNTAVMNTPSAHTLGIIGSDEYVLSDAIYNALPQPWNKTVYRWDKDPYPNIEVDDWNYSYWHILYANTALAGAEKLKDNTDLQALSNLKGCALFHRAINFYQLAQTFCKPFTANAENEPGIPLRLEEDINLTIGRGTLQQTYNQIINDLEQAAGLLPENAVVKFRPGKPAAYAMLAKTFLQMDDYNKALEYANAYLSLKPALLDFNTVDLTPRYPFTDFNTNVEVVFVTGPQNNPVTGTTRINVLPALLNSYATNDLRKQAYFFNNTDGRVIFKGSYRASGGFFTGIATDEIYLIRAECYARTKQAEKALQDLNTLRKNRYQKAGYTDITETNTNEILRLIITERRKELPFRGTRWEDLRRLNKESEFAITLTRTVSGITYNLPPNDNHYTWPIPDKEITLSNLTQNLR